MEYLQKISNLVQTAGSLQQQSLLQFNPVTQRKTIVCGNNYSIALKNNGTITSWGSNLFNQLNHIPTDSYYIAVACGEYHSVALKNNSRITTWGSNYRNQLNGVPTDTGYIAIACGENHSIALKNDGTIITWGNNDYNQFEGIPTDNGYVAIACGNIHNIALKNDGTIRAWGNNRKNQLNRTPTDNGYIAIACGNHYNVALKNDGTIIAWGNNEYNQLVDTPTDNGYLAIACGENHSIALKNDGTIRSWGNNNYNQLDNTPTDNGYIVFACSSEFSVALKNDGTIRSWGNNDDYKLDNVPTDNGYIDIACDEYHGVALKNDGSIRMWGNNAYGQFESSPTDNNIMTRHSLQQFNYYQSLITNGLSPVQQQSVQQQQQSVQQQQQSVQQQQQPAQQQQQPAQQQSDSSIIYRFYDSIARITGSNTRVNIDRNNIFESLKRHIRDKGTEFFTNGTYIKFTNEAGIDQGGLTREFFSLLTEELKQKYFITYDSGYSSFKNDEDKPNDIDDYYLIGQMFAYAVKSKNNINIKLNPLILDFMANSKKISKIDITNSEYSILFDMFDNTTKQNNKKILKLIQLENEFTSRQHPNLNTLEEIKKIFNDYEPNILGSQPYSVYLTLSENRWNDTAKICLNEPGAICLDYMDTLDIPFEKKDIYLLFIIKSLAYTQYLAEFHKFLDGFNSIIKLEILNILSLKQINKIIVGDRTLNIDDILSKLKIRSAGDKESMIREIIREESEKNEEYLNKLVYLITGSESLPLNEFRNDEFRIIFTDVIQIKSHTCDGLKYVEIPITVLQESDEEVRENLKNILSYDAVVASGQSAYCMAGGSQPLIDQLRNFVF